MSDSKEESLKERLAPLVPSAATSQDESKVTDALTEKTNATIRNNEKVPRPLGPLDNAQIKTIVEQAQAQVLHNEKDEEQQVDLRDGNNDSDEKAEAGDTTDMMTAIEASGEQGDNLPYTVSSVVNHLKGKVVP